MQVKQDSPDIQASALPLTIETLMVVVMLTAFATAALGLEDVRDERSIYQLIAQRDIQILLECLLIRLLESLGFLLAAP